METAVAGALVSFIEQLSSAQCVEEAWQATVRHFQHEELPWLSYGYKECSPKGQLLDDLSNLPDELQQRWRADRLYERDPMIGHVAGSMLPAVFGIDEARARKSEPDIIDYYERMAKLGARSIYCIALRCVTRGAAGYFMLGGPRDPQELRAHLHDAGQRLALAVFYADLRLQEMFHKRLLSDIHLTRRERQCLELLSAGLRNDRIAAMLGVSEVTVRLHFTNARNKLRTSTREQAVARATMLGLIHL